ncbi:hypothetical protein C0993_010612 [Termitomyces sp. T159_Od127]|nr:hypothetical protein C0993_010612 [Termitomyces sp. T159_Od127]
MSSPVASTFTSKVSKNPGLTIDLKADTSRKLPSNLSSISRVLPSSVSSLTNTPALEPDWMDEDNASDNGNNDDVQYIYISSDSTFYRPPATPRTSSYVTVSGFPFACDALIEEDSLFADFAFDDESSSNSGDDNVMIVDTDLTEESDLQYNTDSWKFTETLDQIKSTRTDIDNEVRSQHACS